MPRPQKEDYAEGTSRRRGAREDYHDEHDGLEEESAFDHEEGPPRRSKALQKSTRRHADDDEADGLSEDSESDRPVKKMPRGKGKGKSKSAGMELVLRKKAPEPSSEEDEEESSSDEEPPKRKGKKKSKGKARKEETITKKAWEPVPRDEVDPDFFNLLVHELGQRSDKIWQGIEDNLLERHSETGEYNISGFFEDGVFSKKDKKKWDSVVQKLKQSKTNSRKLFCSIKTEEETYHPPAGPVHRGNYGAAYGPAYGSAYSPAYSPGPRTVVAVTAPTLGHRQYNPRCLDCTEYGRPCHHQYSGYGHGY
ncbi:MAG: hypothetical protein LQ346_000140 [Caloplaca aetnensis]|nr:MAG: hypothetical protein LQ346_000140 [Caloplaca aetnensis]